MKTRREIILDTVSDLVSNFVYYDRKEDEDLSITDLDEAIQLHEITIDEIVDKFKDTLKDTYPD